MPALLVALLLSLPLPADAVSEAVAAYGDRVDAIVAEALSRGRARERLEQLVSHAPHRLAGSPGYLAAAEWARQTMEHDGLENVRFQWVDVPRWTRGSVGRVRLVEPAGLARDLPMLALGGSVATPVGGLTAEVVVVDSLAAARDLGDRAQGRIVLFNGPMDRSFPSTFSAYGQAVGQRGGGASAAARVGGVAALVRSMTTQHDDVPHTGAMRYSDDAERVPTAALSTNAAQLVADAVARGERVVLHFEQDCRTWPDVPNPNVIGEYRGTDLADEILVVGGHLDCWDIGQGAHDDGGGCCQSIEAVRLLSTLGLRPRRTIRVVLFANEENGLRGGDGYRDGHLEEMPRHLLAMESDSGSFSPRGFRTNATGGLRTAIDGVGALLADWGVDQVRTGSGGADVNPMIQDGVTVVGLQPDSHRYFDVHHSANDTIDRVNEREINLGAAAMASLLYVVADLDPALLAVDAEGSR